MIQSKLNWQALFNYGVFAIAMGYLEAAVVVYLRLLYYPDGFQFPLKIIPTDVAVVEIGRELSTIIMLWFAARTFNGRFRERFIVFIFMFGVWDLFYYFWLKVLLNWPSGWLDWDILFLIPAPWVGPWLAPALVSIGFIAVAMLLCLHPEKFDGPLFSKKFWLIEIISALLILLSFFWETARVVRGGVPQEYPWLLFLLAYLLGFATFLYGYWKKSDAPKEI